MDLYGINNKIKKQELQEIKNLKKDRKNKS